MFFTNTQTPKNKILLQNERYQLLPETYQAVLDLADQLISPALDSEISEELSDSRYIENYIKLLLFVKYLDVFDINQTDKQTLSLTLDSVNQKLYEKLQNIDQQTNVDAFIAAQDIYNLPENLRRRFEFSIFRQGQEQFSLKELLLTLKGEVISKVAVFSISSQDTQLEDLNQLILREFQFATANKTHVYYLKGFSNFLRKALSSLKPNPNAMERTLEPHFTLKGNRVYLSLKTFGHFIKEMTMCLSNPASNVRKYALEILTKIEPYDFPESKVDSKIIGECDALRLCLEVKILFIIFMYRSVPIYIYSSHFV